MRAPTNREHLYAWHAHALQNYRHPCTDTPECGWYVLPTGKIWPLSERAKTPMLPASIYVEQQTDENGDLAGDERLVADVAGQLVTDEMELRDLWLRLASFPISEGEYDALILARMGSSNYRGPQRPRSRWIDTFEIQRDMERNINE